jgi:hypothetical protein
MADEKKDTLKPETPDAGEAEAPEDTEPIDEKEGQPEPEEADEPAADMPEAEPEAEAESQDKDKAEPSPAEDQPPVKEETATPEEKAPAPAPEPEPEAEAAPLQKKKINQMTLAEIERRLKDVQDTQGGLDSKYARQLLSRKRSLKSH